MRHHGNRMGVTVDNCGALLLSIVVTRRDLDLTSSPIVISEIYLTTPVCSALSNTYKRQLKPLLTIKRNSTDDYDHRVKFVTSPIGVLP